MPRFFDHPYAEFKCRPTEEMSSILAQHNHCIPRTWAHVKAEGDSKWEKFSFTKHLNEKQLVLRRTDTFEVSSEKLDYIKGPERYFVVVHESARRMIVVCYSSLLLALSFAYSKQKVGSSKRSLKHLDFATVNRSYKILQPILELEPDIEHNTVTKAEKIDVEVEDFKTIKEVPEFPEGSCISEVYENFRRRFLKLLESRTGNAECGWGSKSNCVGTLEALPGEEPLLRMAKRHISFEYVSECVDKNGYCPLVTKFHKAGCVTSSGKLRAIFPMNITYENALRRFFAGCRVDPYPHKIVSGRNFAKRKMHYYDVKSCDKVMYPYIVKLAKEVNMVPLLVPLVHTPSAQHKLAYGYSAEQFPSGVYHTTLMTTIFSLAVADAAGVRAEIQGDGMASDTVINHEYLRNCEDFNGFVFDEKINRHRYCRAHRLLEYKFLRGNGPQGINRFVICRAAYRMLDAVVPDVALRSCKDLGGVRACYGYSSCLECKMLVVRGKHLADLKDREVLYHASEMYSNLGRIVKLACVEVGVRHDTRSNGWDSAPLKEIKLSPSERKNIGISRFPRYELSL